MQRYRSLPINGENIFDCEMDFMDVDYKDLRSEKTKINPTIGPKRRRTKYVFLFLKSIEFSLYLFLQYTHTHT